MLKYTKLINFGLKLDKLQEYLQGKMQIPVFSWKPSSVPKGPYCYFKMESNSEAIKNDNSALAYMKIASLDFVIASWKSDTPEVEMYELLNKISEIFLQIDGFSLDDLQINLVEEGQQSGVFRDDNNNPLIIGEYKFHYKYAY